MKLPEHLTYFEDYLTWDYWFYRENNNYHAYFLQYGRNEDLRYMHSRQSVGHAVSNDFRHFEYAGTVIKANSAIWNDTGVATGSVVKHTDGRYYMLFTGISSTNSGIGLAISDDLCTWNRFGDGPIISCTRGNVFDEYESSFEGKPCTIHVLADPYVYPERIGGYYYAVINSWIKGAPKNARGCQAMFRSRDCIQWESYKVVMQSDRYDRTETAQFWEKNEKWYLSFGGVNINPDTDYESVGTETVIYMADQFDGPYLPQKWSTVKIDTTAGYYLCKTIKDPHNEDVLLILNGNSEGVLGPFTIAYEPDGALNIGNRQTR